MAARPTGSSAAPAASLAMARPVAPPPPATLLTQELVPTLLTLLPPPLPPSSSRVESSLVRNYITCLPRELQGLLPPATALDRAKRYHLLLALIRTHAAACHHRLRDFIDEGFQEGVEILFETRREVSEAASMQENDKRATVDELYPLTLLPYFTQLYDILDSILAESDPATTFLLLSEFQRVAVELVRLNIEPSAVDRFEFVTYHLLMRLCKAKEAEEVVRAICRFVLKNPIKLNVADLLNEAAENRNIPIYYILLQLAPSRQMSLLSHVVYNYRFSAEDQRAIVRTLFQRFPQECFDQLVVTPYPERWLEECFKEASTLSKMQQAIMAKLDTLSPFDDKLFAFLLGKLDAFKLLLERAKAVGGETLVEEIVKLASPENWTPLKRLLTEIALPEAGPGAGPHPLLANPHEVVNILKAHTV